MPDPIEGRTAYQPNDRECYEPDSSDAEQSHDVRSSSMASVSDASSSRRSPMPASPAPAEAPSPGSAQLQNQYLKSRAAGRRPLPSGEGTDNNQARTSDRKGIGPYAESGRTSSGDASYAGAAVLKGRAPGSGADVELVTISGQLGAQNEAQLGLLRVGVSGDHASLQAELATVRAHGGIHNDDGSVGANVGAMATAASVESTVTGHGFSLTAGVGVGKGGSVGAGMRDADNDGNPEVCFRVSGAIGGKVTVGACVELPGRQRD